MSTDARFPNLTILDHPLILHKLTHMRMHDTSTRTFRGLLREISMLMGYEMTRDLPTAGRNIDTPMGPMDDAPVIEGRKVAVVPILRAGLGMADGLLDLMPSARVGHIGLYRDEETLRPKEYLIRLPDLNGRMALATDPMLATGHSAAYAIDILKREGLPGQMIKLMVLVAAPEGTQVMLEQHPDVRIYTASLDKQLNDKAYILPGLGDAGDRLFGTK